jgi:hypothetical protein
MVIAVDGKELISNVVVDRERLQGVIQKLMCLWWVREVYPCVKEI